MITHILKDGTVLKDITGHVVKKEDVPMAYELIDQMNEKRSKQKRKKENEHEKVQNQRGESC
jgi:hypothetical protein